MMNRRGTKARRHQGTQGSARRGFSFAEVLFAVAVLGIGFIMVAAIFPVAIQQTQATMEETVGTAVTRNAIGYLQGTKCMSKQLLANSSPEPATVAPPGTPPPGPLVFSFNDPRMATALPFGPTGPPAAALAGPLWDSVRQNLIQSDDPRFAFVPMYQRDFGGGFAKLTVIAVRVRDRDRFIDTPPVPPQPGVVTDVERVVPASTVAELEPRPVKVLLKYRTTNPVTPTDRMFITNIDVADDPDLGPVSIGSNAMQAAGPGAYVIISDDRVGDLTTANSGANGTPFTNEHGQLNGRVYRLASEIMPSSQGGYREFELAAGEEMSSIAEELPSPNPGSEPAFAFVVGRGYANPATPANGYAGSVQAVQRFQAIVKLR